MNRSDDNTGVSRFLEQLEAQTLPPVSQWNPSTVRDMDLRIDARGEWYYQGTVFKRRNLVRLLSTVLIREGDEYFLVSPAEKLRIVVEDAPFIATDFEIVESSLGPTFIFDTNVDFKAPLDSDHPFAMRPDPAGERAPYLRVRDGLDAKLARGVYYRLVDRGVERRVDGEQYFGIESAGEFFALEPVTW